MTRAVHRCLSCDHLEADHHRREGSSTTTCSAKPRCGCVIFNCDWCAQRRWEAAEASA